MTLRLGRRVGVSLLTVLLVTAVPKAGHADIIDGRYGVNQVFDVQRSPAFPTAGSPFTLSAFDQPYDDNTGQYNMGTGYIQFFYTGDSSNLVGIRRYDSGGTLLGTVSALGSIYGLSDEGFLYVAHGTGYGTFVSNVTGFSLGDSTTFTAGTALATLSQLQAYAATSQLLGIGQTVTAGSSGAVLTNAVMVRAAVACLRRHGRWMPWWPPIMIQVR